MQTHTNDPTEPRTRRAGSAVVAAERPSESA
jgi:hypothetical protein